MSKRLAFTLLAVTAAAVAVAAVSGIASASPSAKAKVVPIVMHDPGCHWFMVGGKYKTSLTVAGATTFRNLDEAALIFKGAGFVRQVPVGKSITLAKPGVYHVTMVKQAPDDNHLLLVVA